MSLSEPILAEVLSPNHTQWKHRLARFLGLALLTLGNAETKDNVNPLLRWLELATSPEKVPADSGVPSAVFRRLFAATASSGPGGYFGSLRLFCDRRLPPLLSESAAPPTPLAAAVLELFLRPVRLSVGVEEEDPGFSRAMRCDLRDAVFVKPFSEQVRLFLLPALASSTGITVFDLITREEIAVASSTCWMLYSYLKLGTGNDAGICILLAPYFFSVE